MSIHPGDRSTEVRTPRAGAEWQEGGGYSQEGCLSQVQGTKEVSPGAGSRGGMWGPEDSTGTGKRCTKPPRVWGPTGRPVLLGSGEMENSPEESTPLMLSCLDHVLQPKLMPPSAPQVDMCPQARPGHTCYSMATETQE